VFDIFPGGTETFYYNLAPYSQELGVLVHTYLLRSINLLDRKVKSRNLYVLRHTNIPAVLVEVAFLSNDYEFSRLQDTSFREKAAEGIFNDIEAYLGGAGGRDVDALCGGLREWRGGRGRRRRCG